MLQENPASVYPKPERELSEDVERISRLLAEYSGKLKDRVDEIDRRRRRFLTVLSIGLGLLGITVGLWPAIGAKNALPLLSITISVAFSSMLLLISDISRDRALREGAKTNCLHLARLVRKVSQLEEYGEGSLGTKIELDLRLTEAETLLRYAQRAFGLADFN